MRVRTYKKKLKLVQNFAESVKFFPYYPDKHHNTQSLKRGKTKITKNMCCTEIKRGL